MTKIKLNNGNETEINKGDMLFLTLTPENSSILVRGSYIETKKDGNVLFSIVNSKYELEEYSAPSSRVVRVERSN